MISEADGMHIEPIWESLLSGAERRELSPGLPAAWPKRPDVLIVGGGLIGLSIACELARRGAGELLVVERGELAGGASRANGGALFAGQMRSTFPEAYRELGRQSRARYAAWAEEEWADFDWQRSGSLAVLPETFPVPLAEYATAEQAAGRGAELVGGPDLHELEPALSPEIEQGLAYADDATLNPLHLALCLTRELRRCGATLASGVAVVRLVPAGHRIEYVATSAGELEPGTVVVTTGWAGGQLLEPLGLCVPLQPAKGQLLATAPLAARMRVSVLSGQLQRQLPTGEILAGGTIEFVRLDRLSGDALATGSAGVAKPPVERPAAEPRPSTFTAGIPGQTAR